MSALPQTALAVRHLAKSFGGLRVTDEVNLAVEPGERRLIIGPNGAGKTTLFNLITGELRPDGGTISLFDRDITRVPSRQRPHLGIARTYQIITLFPGETLLRNVTLSLLGLSPLRWNPLVRLERREALMAQARETLARVDLDDLADRPLAQTAYGERRRVEIAMALAQKPRVLLLDEPFAGLSIPERRDVLRLVTGSPRGDHRDDRARHGRGPRLRRAHHGPALRAGRGGGHAQRGGGAPADPGDLFWRVTLWC